MNPRLTNRGERAKTNFEFATTGVVVRGSPLAGHWFQQDSFDATSIIESPNHIYRLIPSPGFASWEAVEPP